MRSRIVRFPRPATFFPEGSHLDAGKWVVIGILSVPLRGAYFHFFAFFR
jgi:hypothetical protein